MKKTLFFVVFLMGLFLGNAQHNPWNEIDETRLLNLEKIEHNFEVKAQIFYQLNLNALKNALENAPLRGESQENSGVILNFPNANGQSIAYRIYEAPVIDPSLSTMFPNIKSYVGTGVSQKNAMIRFSVSIFGFHGMIFSSRGTHYINPYSKDLQHYTVFAKNSIIQNRDFECLVDEDPIEIPEGIHFSPRNAQNIDANSGIFRTYRLALACTEEYAAYHINAAGVNAGTLQQRQEAILAAMNTTMTRVNGIYERDMSLTMVIIPNNLPIMFLLPENPDDLNNNNGGTLINQIQAVVDNLIGPANYDIGHVFSTGGGGIAQLNSPCTSNKARGVTGQNNPVGDPFDIDYVAHEMGHQYGATHTQNNNCQRSGITAVEPGSASTIMGYAGICAPNVQGNSDAHFHAVSMAQMDGFVAGLGNCSNNVNNNNNPPVIPPLTSYSIPVSTAFVLKGSATDADGDALTFSWEQTNNQISTQPPVASSTGGPNFRSLPPSESPDRYMPNFQTVLGGATANTWEVVPSVARTMNFALTVRDNGTPLGGQTARRNMTVTTVDLGGPFAVTSQATPGNSWVSGETETITWSVAGTTQAPINTANVNILMSVDGGENFDIVLAANTPNDGSETITVPDVVTENARILIESVGNIFYAVNTAPIAIGVECILFVQSAPIPIPDGVGSNSPGATISSVINVTEDGTIDNNLKIGLNISHTWIGDLVVSLEHPDGTQINLWNRNCNNPQQSGINVTFENGAPAIVCASPTTGTFSPAQSMAAFNGKPINGIWTLRVTDFFVGDTGTLNNWSLDFGCTTLSTDTFEQSMFAIYPNPNTGTFTIKTQQAPTNTLQVKVYDLRGRTVYQNTFAAASTETTITLDQVQSGVYMVEVMDGNNKETKRIIVQ